MLAKGVEVHPRVHRVRNDNIRVRMRLLIPERAFAVAASSDPQHVSTPAERANERIRIARVMVITVDGVGEARVGAVHARDALLGHDFDAPLLLCKVGRIDGRTAHTANGCGVWRSTALCLDEILEAVPQLLRGKIFSNRPDGGDDCVRVEFLPVSPHQTLVHNPLKLLVRHFLSP